MEQKRRTWLKALTWQALGILVMSLINYLYLGDWQQSTQLSIWAAVIGLICYVLHERIWGLVRWGQSPR